MNDYDMYDEGYYYTKEALIGSLVWLGLVAGTILYFSLKLKGL
jgi:hypothetical protein